MNLKRQLVIIGIVVSLVPAAIAFPAYSSFRTYISATRDVELSNELVSQIYSRRLIASDYLKDKSERAKTQWYVLENNLIERVASSTLSVHSNEEKLLIAQVSQKLATSKSIFDTLVASEQSQDNLSAKNEKLTLLSDQLTVTAQETIQAVHDLASLNQKTAESAFATILALLFGALTIYLFILALCFYILWKSAESMEKIDKMKSEFISLASHQLKTPLTSIRWYSELLINQYGGKLAAEQAEYLRIIYTSVLNMNELVNTLLNISRIESGRLMVQPKPTDISKLLDELTHELTPKIRERKQSLTIRADGTIGEMMVDPGLLRQIYLNLITNAMKYSPDESSITVHLKMENGGLISSVADKGYGIPPQDKERVFQKFYRGENILKKGQDGTGLGLYLIKTIVESFKGKVWFTSTLGEGTVFYFSIPSSGMQAKEGVVGLS